MKLVENYTFQYNILIVICLVVCRYIEKGKEKENGYF